MTHLRIEQNNIPEQVTTDIISKLYKQAKAIIDEEELNQVVESQVSLRGNLQVDRIGRTPVEYLQSKFPDLHITVTDAYVMEFLDPAAYTFFKDVINNGVAMTETQFKSLASSDVGRDYYEPLNYATFKYLPELKLCKSITYLHRFQDRNLIMADFSNITRINSECFANACVSEKIWLTASQLTDLNVKYVHRNGSTDTKRIIMPENLQKYHGQYNAYSSIKSIFFRTQTPPTFYGPLTDDNMKYYVPVGTSQAYQNAIANNADGHTWGSSNYQIIEYDYEQDELSVLTPFVYPSSVT